MSSKCGNVCVVKGCPNGSVNSYDKCLSYFTIPTNNERHNLWCSILNVCENLDKVRYVCQLHFDNSSFTTPGKCRLKKDAVPTCIEIDEIRPPGGKSSPTKRVQESTVTMANILKKKPRLMLPEEDTSVSRILPSDISLEPKYLVQLDKVKQAVFIAIPATNPARKEEMSLVGKIVLELNICPAEWKRSIVRLVGSSNNAKVYEGGTEYYWQRSNPFLKTIIVVKKIENKQRTAGSADKTKPPNRVDQQRHLLQQMKQIRHISPATRPSVLPIMTSQPAAAFQPLINLAQLSLVRPAIPVQVSKSVIPSGKSISCRVEDTTEKTPTATSSQQSQDTVFASEDSEPEIKIENEEEIDDVSSNVEGDNAYDDPPFRIIDWSRVDVPINKDPSGHVYFSQRKEGAARLGLLRTYHDYLQTDFTFPHDSWSARLSLAVPSSKRVLSIFEMSNKYEPLTILRSIQIYSDGTIIVGINGKDCTEAFLKKISIEKSEDVKELIVLLTTATNCAGSIGFDIVAHCEEGVRVGKVWFAKNCEKVIFDETNAACSACQLVRNILRVEKANIYRQVHEMEQEKLQSNIADAGDDVKPESFELGKAIYDLIGGFWDELKIEEEAKANNTSQQSANNGPETM